MARRGHVLVLDGDKVHALDIVRSLGRSGVRVTAGAARPDALAFTSRFAAHRELYPDPAANPAAFIEWLETAIGRIGCELVIPVTDLTVVPVSTNLTRLRHLCAVATEPFDRLQLVTDKSRTLELARLVGVPCPVTVVVSDERGLDHHAGALTYPVVCKPMASSVWTGSGYHGLQVFYALDEEELRREVARRLPACPVMLQEYRRGHGVGVEVLARNGEIVQAFQHRRLHELPLTGGGSTYRVSTPVDPLLHDYSVRLLAAIGWTGVAMVEFKVDGSNGEAVLMEINGRFWGSLPLSSRAGMNFAVDLYEMLVRGTVPAKRSYAPGVRCRKLRDDLEWFKEMIRLDAAHPYVQKGLVRKVSGRALLAEIARLFWPADRYDVQTISDPAPGLRDLRHAAATQTATIRKQAAAVRSRLRSIAYRIRTRARLAGQARAARKVLFVCYGNIMRSPFASGYLALRGVAGRERRQVRSAGFYERIGRPADARAVAASRQWGVDLSSHCSNRLDEDVVAWADLILVMDHRNLAALRRLYPTAAGKTYLLGSFGGDIAADVEIGDPFDGPYEATERSYVQIAAAIDRFVTFGARAEAQS